MQRARTDTSSASSSSPLRVRSHAVDATVLGEARVCGATPPTVVASCQTASSASGPTSTSSRDCATRRSSAPSLVAVRRALGPTRISLGVIALAATIPPCPNLVYFDQDYPQDRTAPGERLETGYSAAAQRPMTAARRS